MWDKVRHQLPTAEDRAALYSAGLYAATVARAGVGHARRRRDDGTLC